MQKKKPPLRRNPVPLERIVADDEADYGAEELHEEGAQSQQKSHKHHIQLSTPNLLIFRDDSSIFNIRVHNQILHKLNK
jgi:hypothetical protein